MHRRNQRCHYHHHHHHHHYHRQMVVALICTSILAVQGDFINHHRLKSRHYLDDYSGTAGNADNWGSKLKDAASSRKPNANVIFPAGPMKMSPAQNIFLSENCTTVLAQIGSTPILHCEVADIGEGTVSWIRRKDYHLLTVGLATYSSDDRFFAAHVHSPQDWALHVRHARARDGGLYECQVSTHPPSSLFVELQLVEARAEIPGAPDKFVKSGSSLRLTCLFKKSTEQPVYVFWYHETRMINYDLGRGIQVRHGRYFSELVLEQAQKHDSGNYSCVPSNAHPASISVHILNGEKPAAMHGSKSQSVRANLPWSYSFMAALCVSLLSSQSCFWCRDDR
ncbi:titin-like [Zootermopsis nevadensis]|uniref:titin-like n=1 Tax=Zootermopsis nevadensis TaxID=136037 RepID=UPI000B8E2689|nr:titin-like [Zootermopsis nevadensis]XP_021916397.1 titin-like [Zootermopsis nevadensis]